MNELNAFLRAESEPESTDDWGQFSTLETPPQPHQFKARVKPVLPRIQEEEKEEPSWGAFIARHFIGRNVTTLEKILEWLS